MLHRCHKPPKQSDLQRLVDDFNTRYPVGSQVILRTDSGERDTRVIHAAEVMGGHSAVAWFDGIRGAYSIEDDRVRPWFAPEPCDAVA